MSKLRENNHHGYSPYVLYTSIPMKLEWYYSFKFRAEIDVYARQNDNLSPEMPLLTPAFLPFSFFSLPPSFFLLPFVHRPISFTVNSGRRPASAGKKEVFRVSVCLGTQIRHMRGSFKKFYRYRLVNISYTRQLFE